MKTTAVGRAAMALGAGVPAQSQSFDTDAAAAPAIESRWYDLVELDQ